MTLRMPGLMLLFAVSLQCPAQEPPKKIESAPDRTAPLVLKESTTTGSVRVGSRRLDYQAIAGTQMVSLRDADQMEPGQDAKDLPQASMSYAAYFIAGSAPAPRPVVFFYNGGPGAATLWLHMGAFGPVRVLTPGEEHLPAAPYRLVPNEFCLLDVADLVFIDAPGTGFGRVSGKDADKAFYGIDGDARAFARFIEQFLTRYGRWNSPKYLFGESYGTLRSAVLARDLQQDEGIDLNGVILLSQVLDAGINADSAALDPGNDLPYELALPSYAAVAWYHKLLPDPPATLDALLREVEAFAQGEYAQALAAGNRLDPQRRHVMAERLHAYTGLPVPYLEKADLRVSVGEFTQTLQVERGLTTGRFDARFAGPSVDLLDKEAVYDPMSSAVDPAYVVALNDYVRGTLKFGDGQLYRAEADAVSRAWDFRHKAPGSDSEGPPNVLPDLAFVMKQNPSLKVLRLAGIFDLATPYFAGSFEMQHLPLPPKLLGNIETKIYPSGHMVYVHPDSLPRMHDDVADFIRRTSNIAQ